MSSLASSPWLAVAIAGAVGCTTGFESFTVSANDAGVVHPGGAGATGGATTIGSGGGPASSSGAGGSAGSAGSGGGAGGSAACSPKGTNTATDDFEGPDLSNLWGVPYESQTTFAQTGGKAVIKLADQDSGQEFAGIYTILDDYDLRDCSALVQIVEVPDTGKATEMYFFVGLGTNADGFFMREIEGKLRFELESDPGLDVEITFEEAEQKWWRIRHEADTIHFETSKDGKHWTDHHQVPAPSWIDTVKIDFGAGSNRSVSSPGLARFDNLNLPP